MSASVTAPVNDRLPRKLPEMPFLVAPCRDLDRAVDAGITVDDARGFERIDHAERPIEPAGMVLAFEMRAREQLRSCFRTGAEHIADAVDCRGEVGIGQVRRQPVQRAQMRLRECRLVHAGLVGADRAQCIEIGEHALAVEATVDAWHGWTPDERLGASIPS
jgi:hypothetical protein